MPPYPIPSRLYASLYVIPHACNLTPYPFGLLSYRFTYIVPYISYMPPYPIPYPLCIFRDCVPYPLQYANKLPPHRNDNIPYCLEYISYVVQDWLQSGIYFMPSVREPMAYSSKHTLDIMPTVCKP